MAVPQRLRAIRLDQALSQRDLAINADVIQTTIVKAEAGGDVRSSTQRKLTEALGVQPRELVGAERSA
jgi:predicted transcriptional regulator